MTIIHALWGAICDLWGEIMTPSPPDETIHSFTVVAISHAVLGAAFSFAGGWFVPIYWLAKELGDLRRSGSYRDGLWDTFFVALGVWLYPGPWWWAMAVLVGAGCAGVLVAVIRRASRIGG